MQLGDVLPLDVRHFTGTDLGVDEQLDRALVLRLGARLASHGDMFLEEPLTEPFHGRRLARLIELLGGVATTFRHRENFEGADACLLRCDRAVRSNGYEPLAPLDPALDDVDLAATRPDTKTEALEFVVP